VNHFVDLNINLLRQQRFVGLARPCLQQVVLRRSARKNVVLLFKGGFCGKLGLLPRGLNLAVGYAHQRV
jgi:hypothetical protein